MKNVITGGVTETSFNPTAKFEQAYVERKDMEYSYNDGDLYYFMDPETYDLVPIGAELLGDNFRFVKENMVCKINSYKGKIFAVEPPTFVELEITETDPGFRGDTATNVTKPATLETGAEIKVPLFINPGDKIKIDTRTGEYLERRKAEFSSALQMKSKGSRAKCALRGTHPHRRVPGALQGVSARTPWNRRTANRADEKAVVP